jgi:general secretion pathway protein K
MRALGKTRIAERGPRARARVRRGQRGAALLLAIVSIAVVTALTVDLAYDTRVSVQLAANARDELKAYYLARSAVGFSRLVLYFQQQLDAPATAIRGAPKAGALGGMPLSLSLRLWEMVPVTSQAMGFFGGAAPPAAGAEAFPAFGGFEGSFDAKIEDEDRKINLRQFDSTTPYNTAQTVRLAELVREPRWDFLFDRDDANGLRVSRPELFAAIKDWIDIDETGSAYTGAPLKPFENGYGDENALYDRLPDRYQAKNADFDSMGELYQVAGISDAFMAAFGDRLTIYPDKSATINVNTDDPRELLLDAVVMGGGVVQPVMLDPAFVDKLRAALVLARPLPFLSLSAIQFAQVLQGLGVRVAPEYLAAANVGVSAAFGDRSTTFRIRGTGQVGEVKKSVEALVIFDRRALGLEQDLGRLIHWSEE